MDINRIRSNITNYYKKKKEEQNKSRSKKHNDYWNKYYGSKQWHELRNNYYQLHPCCECHEQLGIVVPAEEVHHLRVWSKALTEEGKWNLLLNSNNIISLCKDCHRLIHKLIEQKNTDYISLNELVKYIKDNNINI